MGRKKKAKKAPPEENTEIDNLLDELDPPDQPEPEEEAPEPEPEPEKEEEAPTADQEEPESEPGQEEPAPEEPETEPSDKQPEPESEPDEGEPEPKKPQAKEFTEAEKRDHALLAEIKKLRAANRKLRAEVAPPMPGATQTPPSAPEPPAATPGETSAVPSGDVLRDMLVFNDGEVGIDAGKMRDFIAQATAPSPEQRDAQLYSEFKSQFLTQSPESAAALTEVEQAYQLLSLHAKNRALEYGVDPSQMNPDDLVGFLEQTGATQEVERLFPGIEEHIPDIVLASTARSNRGLAQAIRRYAGSRGNGRIPGTTHHAAAPSTPPQAAAEGPPDLSRVGTSSNSPGKTQKARYDELQKEFNRDPFSFSDEQMSELDELESKFEAKG